MSWQYFLLPDLLLAVQATKLSLCVHQLPPETSSPDLGKFELQKYLPLDLRPKKTRAIRRQLTKHQVRFAAIIECTFVVTDIDFFMCFQFCTPIETIIHLQAFKIPVN
jgi:hypothetical protein